jgi:large subunit ribosomal protein LX
MAPLKEYRVRGKFLMGREMRPFTKVCRAASERAAREYILSDLGSRHRTPRNRIEIEEISEEK